MFRCLMIGFAFYTFGHPHFDGHRPAVMDKPVQEFHAEVNAAAVDAMRAIAVLDDARTMRYLEPYIAMINTQLGH